MPAFQPGPPQPSLLIVRRWHTTGPLPCDLTPQGEIMVLPLEIHPLWRENSRHCGHLVD